MFEIHGNIWDFLAAIRLTTLRIKKRVFYVLEALLKSTWKHFYRHSKPRATTVALHQRDYRSILSITRV